MKKATTFLEETISNFVTFFSVRSFDEPARFAENILLELKYLFLESLVRQLLTILIKLLY